MQVLINTHRRLRHLHERLQEVAELQAAAGLQPCHIALVHLRTARTPSLDESLLNINTTWP